MNKELNFDGLYGEDIIDFVREAIHIAPIQTILHKNDYSVKPHLHRRLFQLFLIEHSTAFLHCYGDEIRIDEKTFFTVPINVLHGISSLKDVEGWVISISDYGLEKTLKLDVDIFSNIDQVNVVHLDMNNPLHSNFYHTLYKCKHEFFDHQPGRDLALEYLTGMLLIRLFRILDSTETKTIEDQNSYKLTFRRFKELIKSHHTFNHSIECYASELNISSSHLNRICKNVSNQTPKKIISNYFIAEAKILLNQSDYSVMDVAYKLGFDDPSYFTRLFKQVAKETPREFRKKLGL